MKENYLFLIAGVFQDLTDEKPSHRWSKEALEKFWEMGVLAFPDLMKDPLSM